jgi:mono/diheme cytochrome c family protein
MMKLKNIVKWIGLVAAGLLTIVFLVLGFQLFAYSNAVDQEYDVDPLNVVASTDSAVVGRGRHLAESLGGCLGCHGSAFQGQEIDDLGPIGVIRAPNLTTGNGGVGNNYTDGELARAIKHGIGNDGQTLRFMPSPDFNWWPESDLTAIVSFIRSLPPVDNEVQPTHIGVLGKILTQFGVFELLVARDINHEAAPEDVPEPESSERYGEFLARSCVGCHGENMSGGPIPGAPSSLPVPLNLTPHETGLGGWTEEVFVATLNTGVRPDGTPLDPFMPFKSLGAMNETEKAALWAFLQSLPPLEFGNR